MPSFIEIDFVEDISGHGLRLTFWRALRHVPFDLLKSCEDLVSVRHAIAGQPCQVVEIAAVVGAHITE